MSADYIVERHKYGMLIKSARASGGVPLECLREVLSMAPKGAVLDTGIASAMGAIFAIGTERDCKCWRDQIEASNQHLNVGQRWLIGTDTGISSKTIYAALTGLGAVDLSPDIPHDPDDFGRCVRLVDLMGWGDRIEKVGEVFPKTRWPALAERWPELYALFKGGRFDDLYADLRQINR